MEEDNSIENENEEATFESLINELQESKSAFDTLKKSYDDLVTSSGELEEELGKDLLCYAHLIFSY